MSLTGNYKYKYIDKIKGIVPAFYIDEDLRNGTEEDILYKVLGKILLSGKENSFVFDVSGHSESEVQKFFIPYNKNTDVTPQIFTDHVLSRYGKTFSDFSSEEEFSTFLSGTILPDIVTNNIAASFSTSAINQFYSTLSSVNDVHEDLVDSLGLMYLLNTSSVAGATTEVSSVLSEYSTSSVFHGKTFTEDDGIKCLFEYIWYNREVSPVLNRYLPYEFQATDASLSSGEFTSGTQYLTNLSNLIGVWTSPTDRDSTFIGDSFDVLNTSGLLESKFESAGPMVKFLKAISYGFYDLDNLIEEIADLLSIRDCPPEFLDYLAGLVGWKLVGGDIDSWRSQLRQAVYVYKAKGTKQALVDAISYVFPKDITTFDASSDIKDSFESYLPNLIYYALKTESPVCQDKDLLISFLRDSQQTSTSVVYNISKDHDTNIRFAVDAILQELDEEFKMIRINGVHYTDTEFYTSQTPRDGGWVIGGSSVNGVGYEGRGGYMLAVPTWENSRFYATSVITKALLSRLTEILTECNEGSRYGISEDFLNDMIQYIKDSIGIDTEGENFYFGNNINFRFHTSSLEYAPNFDTVIANSVEGQVEVLDYWSTKSSNIFVDIEVGSLDTGNGLDSLTPSVISNISQTIREFTPFHSTTRMYIGITVADDNPDAVDSILITIGSLIGDKNTHILDSTQTSAWLGTSGAGDYYSSLDLNQLREGRILPLPSDSFWNVYGTGVDRDASRRRDFKYEIDGEGFSRNGKNNPIPYYFYGSSLSALETTKEYIPKGFNFSGQHYISPESVTFSAVYDSSNSPVIENGVILYSAPSVSFLGSPVSSTFNYRAVDDDIFTSPGRELPAAKEYRVFVDRFLRLGLNDTRNLVFDSKKIQEIELGEGLHNLWIDDKDKFNGNRDGSGFYSLDHAFGPLLYNSTMLASGVVGNSETSGFNAYKYNNEVTLSGVQFTYVIGSDGIKDESYRTHDDQLSLVNDKGLVWSDGWNSYRHELDADNNLITNRSQLSSIEFAFPENSDMISVVNYSTVVDEGCSMRRNILFSGVTFFSGRDSYQDKDRPRFRYPLLRNKNLVVDSSFKETENWVIDTGSVVTYSALSAVAADNTETPFSLNAFYFSGLSELSSVSGNYIKSKNGLSMIPGERYEFSYEVSSENADNSVSWVMVNLTQGSTYDAAASSWSSVTVVNSPVASADSDWKTVSSVVVPDINYNVDDAYIVILGLDTVSLAGSPGASLVHTPKLIEEKANTLFKNKDYLLSMDVDSSSFGNSNKVQVRILTGKKHNQGLTSQYDFFEFDFTRKRWMLSEDVPSTNGIFDLNDGYNKISLSYHTDNLLGPLDLSTRKLMTGDRYSYVHDENTHYYIEIIPVLPEHTEPNDLLKPSVRISNVSSTDIGYTDVKDEYTREEVRLIMGFLDTLTTSIHSRDESVTVPLGLGTNGGSRLVYMEEFGGTNVEPDTAGTTYYNI